MQLPQTGFAIRYRDITTTQAKDPSIHEDKQGNLKGRTDSATIKSGIVRTALWTGGGTLLGICFAPIVGGAVGAGAIVGVATGGAVGLGSNLWRRARMFEFLAERTFNLLLINLWQFLLA